MLFKMYVNTLENVQMHSAPGFASAPAPFPVHYGLQLRDPLTLFTHLRLAGSNYCQGYQL